MSPLAPVAPDDDPIDDEDPAEQGKWGERDTPPNEDQAHWEPPDWGDKDAARQSDR